MKCWFELMVLSREDGRSWLTFLRACALMAPFLGWIIGASLDLHIGVTHIQWNPCLIFAFNYTLYWYIASALCFVFLIAKEVEWAVGDPWPNDRENGIQVGFLSVRFPSFSFSLKCWMVIFFPCLFHLSGLGEMSLQSREPLSLMQTAPSQYLLWTLSKF